MKQEGGSPESIKEFDEITAGVLPQCIMEVEAGIMMRNGENNLTFVNTIL